MNSLLKVLPQMQKYNDYIFNVKKGTNPIMLSGLTDTGKVHMAYSTRFYAEKPICIITYNELQAKKIIKDFEFFGETVRFFPKRDIVSFDYIAESKDTLYKRISVLNNIVKKKNKIVVTTIEAAMQKMIKKESLYKHVLSLKVGDAYNLETLKEKLVLLGYERYDLIEGKGQFSVRGGIVDIANSRTSGVRIEFWGDEIDSIRKFSISSQRTTEMLEETDIFPSYEFLLETDVDTICDRIAARSYPASVREKVNEDIAEIKSGDFINKIDKYFNEFYNETDTLLDYITDDYIIFIDEIEKVKARAESKLKDSENLIKDLIYRNKIVPGILSDRDEYLRFSEKLENKQTIYLEKQDIGFIDKQSMHAKRNGYSFSYREVNFFRSSMDLLFQEVQESVKRGKQTVILGGSTENSRTILNLLLEKNIPCTYQDLIEDELALGVVVITPGAFSAGFELKDANLLVITTEELFENVPKKKIKTSSTFKEGEKIVFADLKEGDYIVHKLHGIGQFLGVNTIKADGVVKDYIKIKYKDDDVLYVPTNSLDNIRKYVGPEKIGPRLNRLGSKDWEKTKIRVKSNLRQVAEELIELYAKRQKMKGFAYSKDTTWQTEFEESFPYQETDDQLRCIEEIKKDMEKDKPMDRLLCGDVGYGKTEVAIRAAFKAVMDGKQVAYLAPTTVLANQQAISFKSRMKDYPIRMDVLNRFKSKKEQTEILNKLERGELDILVGTHRLLSKDVKFKNLGFLIIDEEHRFGVKDKEKIKELKNNIDVLTMTATPIPRTLHMSVVGMRDMSVIYEPPKMRRPVQTYVLEYDPELVKEAIIKELEREGQVFYLFNNVEGILKKADEISKLVPEAKVDVAHGKMNGSELEAIMQDFIDKKSNVLVCTTILESGIDIPNANTIIVENADRLGLAQLYQIRGRVGRSDRQAYAFITYKRDKMLSEVADKRLKAIKEFTEFGSGFKIAMRDLEIRGAGSLMGEIQHGHMEQVGYDMYCKLLDEVVKEIKGEEVIEEVDVQIELNVSSYIPENYIENPSQKIEVYQSIALCRNDNDIADVTDELIDRYGSIPAEVDNLLKIIKIKILSREKYILKVSQRRENAVFYFEADKFNIDIIDKLMKKFRNRIKFSPAKEPYITFKLLNERNVLEEAIEFLENL